MFKGFELVKSEPRNDCFIVHIKGDANDGDYIEKVTKFKKDEYIFEDTFKFLKWISEGKLTAFGEYSKSEERKNLIPEGLREINDELEFEFIPRSDYGISGVKIISFYYYDKDGIEFDVIFK